MTKENNSCNISNCNITEAINIIKSRYSAVLILSLEDNEKNFTTLTQEFDYLTNMQLTRTINKLKNKDIIVKNNNSYKLTKLGQDLIPILKDLENWILTNKKED